MIVLKVNGNAFDGWKSARVSAAVDKAARDFDLTISDRFEQFTNAQQNIKVGDVCTIEVDGQKLITGYVDEVSPSYSESSHEIQITGRSKTADLIDCSAVNKPGQWKGQNIAEIARALSKPYGISVSSVGESSSPVKDFSIQQGETSFAAIERLCRLQGFLASDDENGNLVITRVGSDSSPGALQCIPIGETNNIKSGSAKFSIKDRHSQYIVKGQKAGSDDDDAETSSSPTWSLSDQNVGRYRPLIVVAEGQTDAATARKRAAWERSTRAGKSIEITYTVAGITANEAGDIWKHNTMVRVNDTMLGISGTFLIAETNFSIGNDGLTTELRLTPPEAYAPEPSEKSKKKSSDSVSSWKIGEVVDANAAQ